MTNVDTSATAVEGAICSPIIAMVNSGGSPSLDECGVMIDMARALVTERDEWKRVFGHFLAAIPLSDVIVASGTVQDSIDYFKEAITERDRLSATLDRVMEILTPDEGDDQPGTPLTAHELRATIEAGIANVGAPQESAQSD